MVVLVRLMLTCFIIRAVPAKKLCPNIFASWWEQKPYIYSNQNKPSGALINIFKQSADLCCTNQVHIDWSNKLPSYKAALSTVDAPPPNNSSTSGNVPVWVPFSLLHIAEGSKKMQKELFVTYQMIVFTEVDTRDKLQNLYRGFKRIFSFIMITLLITILFGFFIWLAETRSNEKQFPKPFYRGAWHGFWWAIVTITTVGYGDKSPRTGVGRFVGIVWMTLSLVLYPAMTAEMSSILTDSTFPLTLKKVGALKNSGEFKAARDAGAIVKECESYEHCLNLLRNKELEAIVVNLHAAIPMKAERAKLIVRSTIAKQIPVNIVFYSKDQPRIGPFIDCIQANSMLVTHKVFHQDKDGVIEVTQDALFTTGGGAVAIYLTIGVVLLYFVLFTWDIVSRRVKNNRKIGDFREGVFMGHAITEKSEEPTEEPSETGNCKDQIITLIKKQQKQLEDMRKNLQQLENSINT